MKDDLEKHTTCIISLDVCFLWMYGVCQHILLLHDIYYIYIYSILLSSYNVGRCLTASSNTTGVRNLQIFLLYQGPMGTWTLPDNKVHGANMGPIWGRQDPVGPHVGPMNFAISAVFHGNVTQQTLFKVYLVSSIYFNMTKCKFKFTFEHKYSYYIWQSRFDFFSIQLMIRIGLQSNFQQMIAAIGEGHQIEIAERNSIPENLIIEWNVQSRSDFVVYLPRKSLNHLYNIKIINAVVCVSCGNE